MGADSTPDDVRLAGLDLVSVLEGCAAIRRPSHLPHAGVLDTLDAQARIKRADTKALDEDVEGSLPRCDLCCGQALEVS
jgi:hypothetical protein